jgi:hypothetical protein
MRGRISEERGFKMDASNLDAIEEIAEQTKFSVNIDARSQHVRGPGRKLGWGISPAIERAAATREGPVAALVEPAMKPESRPRPKSDHTHELFFAEATDYQSLRDAIRQRVEQLNVTRNNLDRVAGLPAGYSGKLLAPYAKKKIGGMSLGLLVKAAGLKMILVHNPDASESWTVQSIDAVLEAARLKMILVDDQQALAKVEPMYERRDARQVRLNNDCRRSKGRKRPKPAPKRRTKRAITKSGKPYLAR